MEASFADGPFKSASAPWIQPPFAVGAKAGADGFAIFVEGFEPGAQFVELFRGASYASAARLFSARTHGEKNTGDGCSQDADSFLIHLEEFMFVIGRPIRLARQMSR